MEIMVRFRLAELLEGRGWTAYKLAQEAGLTIPAAYRLADPDHRIQRLDMATLDTLCRVLKVQPGELLEWGPDRKAKRA
jgi:DNA-binding Xre family transcriptional regulator